MFPLLRLLRSWRLVTLGAATKSPPRERRHRHQVLRSLPGNFLCLSRLVSRLVRAWGRQQCRPKHMDTRTMEAHGHEHSPREAPHTQMPALPILTIRLDEMTEKHRKESCWGWWCRQACDPKHFRSWIKRIPSASPVWATAGNKSPSSQVRGLEITIQGQNACLQCTEP